jgi:hypothetical protein
LEENISKSKEYMIFIHEKGRNNLHFQAIQNKEWPQVLLFSFKRSLPFLGKGKGQICLLNEI